MMMQVLYTVIAVLAVATCATASCDARHKENEKLSQIETRLDNLTSQFSAVTLLSTESPLTGVTSLLQLSLLRELLTGYRKESSSGNGSNEEGLATLQRMEALLNTSIVDTAERLNNMEQDIHSLVATVSSIQKDTRQLLDHSNITHTTLNEIVNPEDEDDYTPSTLYHSCEEVLKNSPNSASGYYNLADATGHARHVYCHMNNLCNSGGGWNRVSILNMTNSKEKCPVGLRLYNQNGRRACGRPYSGGASCPGVIFAVHFKYSQVCGKVIGYQKGHPDGTTQMTQTNAEGVKLTHGTSRSHIWSFIASPFEVERYCPCSSGPAAPSYVGSDYYCESGDPDSGIDVNRMYTNDPLWDGKNCRSLEAPCCTTHSFIPWFHKKLGYTTTDYIEMRLCFSEGTNDEDSPVEQYEIYVK